MPSISPFGEKVKSLRHALGFTQCELAAKAGVSERTVRNTEHGRPVHREFLDYIAAALGVDISDLVNEKDEIQSFLDWRRNVQTLVEFLDRTWRFGQAADLVDLIHPSYETEFHFGNIRCGEVLGKYRHRTGVDEARENIDFLVELHSLTEHRDAKFRPAQGDGKLVVLHAEDDIQCRDGYAEYGRAVHLIEFEGRRIRRWTEYCVGAPKLGRT